MQTIYIGEQEFIKLSDGRTFLRSEETDDAANGVEWAKGVLKQPATVYHNGRNSHSAAYEELNRCEDILLDYLCVTI